MGGGLPAGEADKPGPERSVPCGAGQPACGHGPHPSLCATRVPAVSRLRIGCSGWQYDDWRGRLYPRSEPKRRWLELYAEYIVSEEVVRLELRLRARDVALTLGDHPLRPVQTRLATASWRFVRLHRGSRGRDGNYSRSEIAGWAQETRNWLREGDVYVYFNNDWQGFAPANARSLRTELTRRST